MATFDVITVGDAILDTFLGIHDAAQYCRVDAASCQICFDSGSKILVDNAQFELGGNAANVAVGLSRLGYQTALAAEIGDDEFAEKILHTLRKEHVRLDLVKQTVNEPSTFSVCISFMKDRTLFVRHVGRDHDICFDDLSTKWIYITSLGDKWKGLYDTALAFAKSSGANIAFNPGSNQLQSGRESFREILTYTTILFVNREEAEEVVYGAIQHSNNKANEAEVLLKELQKLGPKIVCITDGKNGSYAIDEQEKIFSQSILPGNCVEKTGAGDAYSTGFLGAHMQGKGIQEAMVWGTVESASVIEHIGAQPGLLTKEALEERMKQVS